LEESQFKISLGKKLRRLILTELMPAIPAKWRSINRRIVVQAGLGIQ
jgi:hypothetical protein